MNSFVILFASVIFSVSLIKSTDIYSNKISSDETFNLCEAEFGKCLQKCKVKLIKGDKIQLGSYIQVYSAKGKITEGYILRHIDGNIYILKNKADAKNPEVCGGCCGGYYEIDTRKKEIWGC